MEAARVFIGIPVYRTVEPETLFSVSTSCLNHSGLIHGLELSKDTYIDAARNFLAKRCADDDLATHLWFVDADNSFPQGTLTRLLQHNKPVVGGWYAGRDGIGTAFEFIAENGQEGPGDRVERLNSFGQGLQLVDGVPLGCTLIEAWVLRKMRRDFGDEWWFKRDGKIGEDVWFALRLRDMGIPSYLDNDLECGHTTSFVLTKDHWRKDQERKQGAGLSVAQLVAIS